MKKFLSIVLALMLVLVSAYACAEAELTLKMTEQLPEGHIMATTLHYFAEQIETLSEGKIKCELYVGGVLGDDTAEREAVQMGTVDIIRAELTTMVDLGAQKAVVTTLPYVLRDRDHFWAFAESEVGQEILDSLQEDGTGVVGLNIFEEGARHFFTKNPVNTLEDLKGQKLRVQNTEMWLEIVKALGASPTPMSFSELYSALSSGVVDGAEQPLSGFVSQKFNEVCPYMILDGHVYPVQCYVISELTWNKLTDEQKAVIKEAAKNVEKFNRESIQKAEDEIMAQMGDLGVTVVNVEDKTPWIDAMKPVYEKFGTPEVLDLLARIQAL